MNATVEQEIHELDVLFGLARHRICEECLPGAADIGAFTGNRIGEEVYIESGVCCMCGTGVPPKVTRELEAGPNFKTLQCRRYDTQIAQEPGLSESVPE